MSARNDVSVVIPVHNGESFVCDAIDSVFAQGGPSVEVIVVNNNSTDATAKVVADRYGDRLTLMEEARPSAASARNAGVRIATGYWLAFLDADDIWLPGKLQKQIGAAQESVDAVFTLGEEFHSPELTSEQRERFSCRAEPYPLLTPSSLFLRREMFQKMGDFPEVPIGEFIAWYGWARELGVRDFVVPEVLVRRRIHAHNMTRSAAMIAGYPMAAKWLLDRRRGRAKSAGQQSL